MVIPWRSNCRLFFDSSGNPRLVPNSRGKIRKPGAKELQSVLRTSEGKFVDFLLGCLQWDATQRYSPEDALQQEWILECYAKHARDAPPGRMPDAPSSRTRIVADSHRTRRGVQQMSSTGGFASASSGTSGFGATVGGGSGLTFPPIDASGSLLPKKRTVKAAPAEQSSTTMGSTGLMASGLGSLSQSLAQQNDGNTEF
eukprot:symbB.v1.2.000113.t1/scaffold15.1/size524077/4